MKDITLIQYSNRTYIDALPKFCDFFYLDLNPSLLDVPGLEADVPGLDEDLALIADLLLIGRDPGCSTITPSSSISSFRMDVKKC